MLNFSIKTADYPETFTQSDNWQAGTDGTMSYDFHGVKFTAEIIHKAIPGVQNPITKRWSATTDHFTLNIYQNGKRYSRDTDRSYGQIQHWLTAFIDNLDPEYVVNGRYTWADEHQVSEEDEE